MLHGNTRVLEQQWLDLGVHSGKQQQAAPNATRQHPDDSNLFPTLPAFFGSCQETAVGLNILTTAGSRNPKIEIFWHLLMVFSTPLNYSTVYSTPVIQLPASSTGTFPVDLFTFLFVSPSPNLYEQFHFIINLTCSSSIFHHSCCLPQRKSSCQ